MSNGKFDPPQLADEVAHGNSSPRGNAGCLVVRACGLVSTIFGVLCFAAIFGGFYLSHFLFPDFTSQNHFKETIETLVIFVILASIAILLGLFGIIFFFLGLLGGLIGLLDSDASPADRIVACVAAGVPAVAFVTAFSLSMLEKIGTWQRALIFSAACVLVILIVWRLRTRVKQSRQAFLS
ncbi:hypothetical protein SH139x_004548 [Planctomycetaceae bacterium SH139]